MILVIFKRANFTYLTGGCQANKFKKN